MCEVGAFLRQNFQPSWDPVIAEFELLTESTISMSNKNDYNLWKRKESPPFSVYLASASGRLLWVQHWLCLEIPAPQIHLSDLQFFHHWSDNCLEQALWPVKHTNKGNRGYGGLSNSNIYKRLLLMKRLLSFCFIFTNENLELANTVPLHKSMKHLFALIKKMVTT